MQASDILFKNQESIDMKKVAHIHAATERHWVGNGFYVHTLFSYNDTGKNLDPFLLMDYNPPTMFQAQESVNPNLRGVGEHPHRGFETVTIAYRGEVSHRDSYGGGGTIGTGDVQWMTAGSGIVHEEFHSESFTRTGGEFEMVQLWVNLPAKDKMTRPKYQAIASGNIPTVVLPEQAGSARIIAGTLADARGPASTFSPINMWDVVLNAGKKHIFPVPAGHNAVVLVLSGTVRISGEPAKQGELVTFERGGTEIPIEADSGAKLLLLTGEPLNEPVAGHGPFVMNTREELVQAFQDFHNGDFGRIG